MLKAQAIELLGGSISAAADAIGVTYQAVNKWPAVLPKRLEDRVQAALWRRMQAQSGGPEGVATIRTDETAAAA